MEWIARLVVFLVAFPIHEAAHGWAAYKMGDPTAKSMGRLTLNPFKHLDIIGTICMLVVGIGWAKPVPINPGYFKNRKLGMALSAAAGPASNFVLALISLILAKGTLLVGDFLPDTMIYEGSAAVTVVVVLYYIFYYSTLINISLGIFNLIPVPPFDGSRILFYFLPERYYFGIMRYEQFIMIGIFAVLFTGALDRPLWVLRTIIFTGMDFLTGFLGRVG